MSVLQGEIVMSDELEEAYNAIIIQQVPQRWKVGGPVAITFMLNLHGEYIAVG